VSPDEIIAALPRGARVLAQGGAGESQLLAEAIARSGRADLHVVGVLFPGVNTSSYGAEDGVRVTTFFMTPQLRRAGGAVEFLPLSYTDIGAHLRAQRLDACIAMLSPPDADGLCSFGPAVDFLAELWPEIPVRVGHLNARTPRTFGHAGVPRAALTHVVEAEAPLPTAPPERDDEVAQAIAAHAATLIGDGATLQAGIGKLPGACMRALSAKRDLRVHSGLVGDWALELMEAGALEDAPIVAGLALGGERLYASIASPRFEFRPASHTHAPLAMSGLRDFASINGALQVDLFGQAYAEATADGPISGPGGSPEFARGAKLAGGLRVIVLPATGKNGASRIVAPGAGEGPVSLSRFDLDVVVTEHGIADLRALGHAARAARLIDVAAPEHRAALSAAWRSALDGAAVDGAAARH